MKTLIWKIRYTIEIRKLLSVPWVFAWDMAGSWIESYGDDMDTCTPKQAAEDERDEWLACG